MNRQNSGRFGIRHVVAAAGKNLNFSWKHLDQIILYFTILIGLTILAVQLVLVCTSVFFYAPAFAFTSFLSSFGSGLDSIISSFFGGGTTTTGSSNAWIAFSQTASGPSQDIAFVVLDSVFGIARNSGEVSPYPGFFESCATDGAWDTCTDIDGNPIQESPYPASFHLALHQMFAFYTLGIGYIAGAILLYYIVAIVGETVTTGTPFGQRFNRAWVIPRWIVFFALLAPITFSGNNNGINVAQLITFSVAKFGSNFASNAWMVFIEGGVSEAGDSFDTFFGKGQSMLAKPNIPELGTLAQYLYVVRMCMYAEKIIHGINVIPYVVRPPTTNVSTVTLLDGTTTTYNKMGGTEDDYLPYYKDEIVEFAKAVEFSRYKDVVLRFGHLNKTGGTEGDPDNPPGIYEDEWGSVKPVCGELQFEITSLDPFVIGPPTVGKVGIQGLYWSYIDDLLFNDYMFDETTFCMLSAISPYGHDPSCVDDPLGTALFYTPGVERFSFNGITETIDFAMDPGENVTSWLTARNARVSIEIMNAINRKFMVDQNATWNSISNGSSGKSIHDNLETAYNDKNYVSTLVMPDTVKERGWAGAPLWYNKLAALNGLYVAAIQNPPRPFKYPMVMEEIAKQHVEQDDNSSYTQRFNPRLANGKMADLARPGDQYIAALLYSVFEFWNGSAVQETVFTRKSKNVIIDTINMILGTQGVFDVLENRSVYPLALLSGLGKSMVDAALRNLWIGVVGQGVGEILGDFPGGGLAKVGSAFVFRFGMIGMGIGFVLYYVLPVLPFIYFFFGFSGWIKSIFEAVLAMPLWALAHLKIDGEGLPGPWASNGYFLLLEIFLRPIMIILGYVFSISMFASIVNILHDTYHVVVLNVSGFDIEAEINNMNTGVLSSFTDMEQFSFMRGPVDEIFYSIIYVIMIYMLGLSCFKLVDTIPNSIMRWMGVTASTFHEHMGDPAGQMTGRIFRASQVANIQIVSLISKAQGFKSKTADADTAALMHGM
ncbi:MAG: DotA/TraY family protein [Alphaproteobacteria bacterium]|nr:DotA/TraY family protein [Alphaproteobacteria bacterium]